VSAISLLLCLAAGGLWARSYFNADELVYRMPFQPGGERTAAQMDSNNGRITFTFGKETVPPQDLPKLQWDAWTKPGLIHRQRALPPEPAQAKPTTGSTAAGPTTQPTTQATMPAMAASSSTASPHFERMTTFSHQADPRTGQVRVGNQRITVQAARTVTVFPHWALVLALFMLPAMRYTFRPNRRVRELRDRLSNSYDSWASQTPIERRRQLPLG
jgi:hypothetical protein